jgi:hypothetical protein
MKTILILGLLASVAMVAPVATAHLVVYLPGDDCGDPSIVLPSPTPHGWVGVTNCPYDHDAIPDALILDLP